MILAKLKKEVQRKNIATRLTIEELVAFQKEGYLPVQSSDSCPLEFRLIGNHGHNLWVNKAHLVIKDTERPPVIDFSKTT